MAISKKAMKQQQAAKQQQQEVMETIPQQAFDFNHKAIPYILIFVFTCLIYSNTLWNKYAIDDTIVITDNKFTQKGFAGIKDLMTHDAFVGFFGERGSKLVSGGRYRPLSMVTLAVEYQFFGMTPSISHGINILLFALTCVLLYYLLSYLLPQRKDSPFFLSIAFIASLLFAAHPIHTEAVSNIKGRDEIMGLFFALLTLLAAVKYVKTQRMVHLFWGMGAYILGLLSKENTVTFLAIIPLTFYFFTKAKPKDYLVTLGLYVLPVALFLFMRTTFTASGLTEDSPEILNNPFAYCKGFEERYATIIYTFLLYIKLLIFPHPLSHDYYYNQIPYVKFSDVGFIISLILNAALLIYALVGFFKKSLPAYAILFYFITFSIVSNLLFTVGVLMNERFMFMSSLGFCILLAYLILKAKDSFKLSQNAVMISLSIILGLYSLKTFSRNFVWKDNFTLFKTDAATSPNSSKVQTSLGGDLTKMADEEKDTMKRKELLKESIAHLNKAIEIYPTHSNAWLLLGNADYKLNHDAKNAISIYEKAAAYRVGGYYDALYNMGCVQVENGMPADARDNFLKALAVKADEFTCTYNLAEAYSKLNLPDSSIIWYKKTLELKPDDANCYYKIGTVYGKQLNNLSAATENIAKAISMNPKVEVYYEDLAVAYGMSGRFDEAIAVSQKCIEQFPNYAPAYFNLSVSYRNKGNLQLADQYLQKAQALKAGQ